MSTIFSYVKSHLWWRLHWLLFWFITHFILHIEWILTVTGWERMTPPVVFFTEKGLFMAQPVSWITAKWDSRSDGEILTIATAMYRYARVQARVSVHCNTWETEGIWQKVSLMGIRFAEIFIFEQLQMMMFTNKSVCSELYLETKQFM